MVGPLEGIGASGATPLPKGIEPVSKQDTVKSDTPNGNLKQAPPVKLSRIDVALSPYTATSMAAKGTERPNPVIEEQDKGLRIDQLGALVMAGTAFAYSFGPTARQYLEEFLAAHPDIIPRLQESYQTASQYLS